MSALVIKKSLKPTPLANPALMLPKTNAPIVPKGYPTTHFCVLANVPLIVVIHGELQNLLALEDPQVLPQAPEQGRGVEAEVVVVVVEVVLLVVVIHLLAVALGPMVSLSHSGALIRPPHPSLPSGPKTRG